MYEAIRKEYEKTQKKRDEIRATLKRLEENEPHNTYDIMITRDRLAFWEGKGEGLQFALDHLQEKQ